MKAAPAVRAGGDRERTRAPRAPRRWPTGAPLGAWADHGGDSIGEPLAIMLRTGNARSNTAADHKQVLADAMAQLPFQPGYRAGRKVLVRTDSGGGTYDFVQSCHQPRLQYSIGFGLAETTAAAVPTPLRKWPPRYRMPTRTAVTSKAEVSSSRVRR